MFDKIANVFFYYQHNKITISHMKFKDINLITAFAQIFF